MKKHLNAIRGYLLPFPKRTPKLILVSTLLALALYIALGTFVMIPTGIDLIYIYLQYPVLALFAGFLGPLWGAVIGLVGHLIVDLIRDGTVWWTWMCSSALFGAICGCFAKPLNFSSNKDDHTEHPWVYTLMCLIGSFVVFSLITPVLNILFKDLSFSVAFKQGFFAALSNALTSVIIGQVVLGSAKHAAFSKVIAMITLVNALLLLSWGRRGIGNILVYAVAVISCCLVLFGSFIRRFSKKKVVYVLRMTGIILVVFVLLFMSFIGLQGVLFMAKDGAKAVIVLGAGLDGTEPTPLLKSRLDKAAEYAKRNPDAILILSGGQGEDEIIPEGQAMKDYLSRLGLPEERLYAETESTTTEENFSFSLQLLSSLGIGPDAAIVYVTNDYHCFRAGIYAEMAGFTNAAPLPAATSIGSILPSYFREGLSVIKLLFVRLRGA